MVQRIGKPGPLFCVPKYLRGYKKKETQMPKNKLDELEVVILQKRLDVLREQGIFGKLMFDLGDDFFALMDDKWIFDGVISTIHGFQEMADAGRDDAIGATLPAPKKKRGRKSKKELAEMEMDDADFED
jgi:hypothetical protein